MRADRTSERVLGQGNLAWAKRAPGVCAGERFATLASKVGAPRPYDPSFREAQRREGELEELGREVSPFLP